MAIFFVHPFFTSAGGTVPILVTVSEVGTATKSIKLFVNGIQKSESNNNILNYTFAANDYASAKNEIKILATDGAAAKDSSVFYIVINPPVKTLSLPSGIVPGINYTNPGVTLALYAPKKEFVYVISDLSAWKVDPAFFHE